MEKQRLEFELQKNAQNTQNTQSNPPRNMIRCGVGFAQAVVGAVVLLIRSNPLNPLSHIR